MSLYSHHTTLNCAINYCIPCLYKLYPSGTFTSLNSDQSIKLPPNQRPEMCKRSKSSSFTGLYNVSQSILTVGDGDFSFSLSIAEHFHKSSQPLDLVVTSHESYDSVVATYPNCIANLQRLEQLGAVVMHEVDATYLSSTAALNDKLFDIILWNFPCVRDDAGADGQTNELEVNRNLLRRFFDNTHAYLKKKGEVHVTHKTIEPFSWWGIVDLASENDMKLEGSVVFDKYNYPGYINRKVLDKKSFPSNDAQTYIFMSNRNKKQKDEKNNNKVKSITLRNTELLIKISDENVQQQLLSTVESVVKTRISNDVKNDSKEHSKKRSFESGNQPQHKKFK